MPPSPSVRAAVPEDAAAIAEIHVASWQAAYAGLLPEDFLRGLTAAGRLSVWQRRLADRAGVGGVFVATDGGAVVGFAAVSVSRDEGAGADTGELHAIYLHPGSWSRGLGRLLHDHAVAALRADGYRTATLWVLDTNARARRFYARAGRAADGAAKVETIAEGAVELTEVRYRLGLRDASRPQFLLDR